MDTTALGRLYSTRQLCATHCSWMASIRPLWLNGGERAVTDVTRNNATLTVTGASATTAPAAGTSQTWSVAALPASFGAALDTGETLRLVDATAGASAAQQSEIILLTASIGTGSTSITVKRGVEGTTPVAH